MLDDDACFRALAARDARFDGRFFVGVLTTGIYCRPVCPARTPHRCNVRFYPSAAAAVSAGLRSCQRCRPDRLPGSARWDSSGDLADRALRIINEGKLDGAESVGGHRGRVPSLAADLHISERQLRRILADRTGATPQQLLAARRAQTARLLLEQTPLPMLQVSVAAGFGSVRQFNDAVQRHFGRTPTQLRVAAGRGSVDQPAADKSEDVEALSLKLSVRQPYDGERMLRWWARHAIEGIDEVYGTTLRTQFADGAPVRVQATAEALAVELPLVELPTLSARLATLAAAFDTGANPAAITDSLSGIPALQPLVRRWPGLRIPAALDPWRGAAMSVLGQQVSVKAATVLAARLAALAGNPNRFPAAESIAALGAEQIGAQVRIPRTRAAALVELAGLVTDGEVVLDPAADADAVADRLLAIRGVGPWTVAEIRLRALRDPDVWPQGDAVLGKARWRLGDFDPDAAKPWRSYLAHYLWAYSHDQETR